MRTSRLQSSRGASWPRTRCSSRAYHDIRSSLVCGREFDVLRVETSYATRGLARAVAVTVAVTRGPPSFRLAALACCCFCRQIAYRGEMSTSRFQAHPSAFSSRRGCPTMVSGLARPQACGYRLLSCVGRAMWFGGTLPPLWLPPTRMVSPRRQQRTARHGARLDSPVPPILWILFGPVPARQRNGLCTVLHN